MPPHASAHRWCRVCRLCYLLSVLFVGGKRHCPRMLVPIVVSRAGVLQHKILRIFWRSQHCRRTPVPIVVSRVEALRSIIRIFCGCGHASFLLSAGFDRAFSAGCGRAVFIIICSFNPSRRQNVLFRVVRTFSNCFVLSVTGAPKTSRPKHQYVNSRRPSHFSKTSSLKGVGCD